ncbi:MAG: 3-oxoacyl-[acyl-carrier-protein] reductase FabG [Gammaproteobacteria bacterium]|nr:MAG: 3-oxoacyl-[acyl-carrier-protein] reductase FabG [Gammaproteobacteria bacterium]
MMDFSGRTVFITGASRGFGKSIAVAFRDAGARVIGTATSEASFDDCCHDWIASDFSDIGQLEECAAGLARAEADILINNAGINKIAPFAQISISEFQAIQQVNLIAPFRLCQAAIPAMLAQQWGRIVNISSIWGKISIAQRASYSASKFGLDGLTLALAAEHTENGILANCIAPGFFDTALTRRVLGDAGIRDLTSRVPAQRLGFVDEIARLVIWLSSTENSFISGQNIAIDGGFTRV